MNKQKNKIDTLILNMERDLSFISKKMFIFLCFLAKCRLYSSIFLLILKKILWDSWILCYYTIFYTKISRWWIGLIGFMVLLLVAVSRNFLILCFLYFFETSIEPRKFRLSFHFDCCWLYVNFEKKHQTKSKPTQYQLWRFLYRKSFLKNNLKNKFCLIRKGFWYQKII